MNIEANIRKSLEQIKSDEKGWRKALNGAEGSFSQEFAQENLRRLGALRQMLLNQLVSNERRRKQVMRVAMSDGIFTDRISDGVCEQLVAEGWLEHAAPIPARRRGSRTPAYLPTDKAAQEWSGETAE